MSKKSNKPELFTARDLEGVLNNAVIFSGAPATGEISEPRKRKLREIAQALIEPLAEMIDDELLTPHEAVHILTAAALFTYIRQVKGGDKLPASKGVKELYEK